MKTTEVLIHKEEYGIIINKMLEFSSVSKKTLHQCCLLKKYEPFQCYDSKRHIWRRQQAYEVPLYCVSIEETHNVVKPASITGYGGRKKMVYELAKQIR